jgi:Tol biopolymer transport system component
MADGYAPAWSPDGTRIAFLSGRDGNADIYTMMADGSSPTRITNTPMYEQEPAWSPDDTQLAYAISSTSGFFIQNIDGGAPQPVASQGDVGTISWASNGTRLAYSGYNALYDVFVGIVNADGTQSIRLNVGGWPGDPAWRPRPRPR